MIHHYQYKQRGGRGGCRIVLVPMQIFAGRFDVNMMMCTLPSRRKLLAQTKEKWHNLISSGGGAGKVVGRVKFDVGGHRRVGGEGGFDHDSFAVFFFTFEKMTTKLPFHVQYHQCEIKILCLNHTMQVQPMTRSTTKLDLIPLVENQTNISNGYFFTMGSFELLLVAWDQVWSDTYFTCVFGSQWDI